MTIRMAIVGVGAIARREHLPAIAADSRLQLVAVASTSGDPGLAVPWFATPAEMFEAMAGRLDAVAVCTPPAPRYAIAMAALRAGYDVLLEKPPAATLGEIEELERAAAQLGRTLYASWHSQHAAGVAKAREALAGAEITRLRISWRENIRKYHPGQEWMWAPGGFGVFDTGINALSIASRILPAPLIVRAAELFVPANRQQPIAVNLRFDGQDHGAEFDWRYEEGECWTIEVATAGGRIVELHDGGGTLLVDRRNEPLEPGREYPSVYRRFVELVEARQREVDRQPLRIVADALLVGDRKQVEPFD